MQVNLFAISDSSKASSLKCHTLRDHTYANCEKNKVKNKRTIKTNVEIANRECRV